MPTHVASGCSWLMAVTDLAGEGEFGVVHKAIWYGTVVAAKILKNTSDIALGDFRAEIEVLRKVCHVPLTHHRP